MGRTQENLHCTDVLACIFKFLEHLIVNKSRKGKGIFPNGYVEGYDDLMSATLPLPLHRQEINNTYNK